MSEHNDSIPPADPEFHKWVGPFSDYVSTNATALGLQAGDVAPLTTAVTSWKTDYPAHNTAQANATSAKVKKDNTRADIEAIARPLIQGLQASPKVTDAQRAAMNIHIHAATRTRVPVPSTKPVGIVDTSVRFMHLLRYRDETTLRRGRPAGVVACEIWSKVGGPPPKDQSEMTYVAASGQTPYRVEYTGAQVGQTVYYWLRWVNRRGEQGPWSEPASGTVPG
jgi:hypothetical protein